MYRKYNVNPTGSKIGDCVVRALSVVLNQSWEQTYIELCLQGYLMADMPSSNAVWSAYLKNKNYRRHFVEDECDKCYTVYDFAEENPEGSYIVGTGTHATAVINGDIIDTWDCGNEQPIYYFTKEAV